MTIPAVTLNNGVTIPQLGFGVYKVPPGDTAKAVGLAFEAGYRSIDTATLYENEAEVGEAVAASGLPREEVFVTTKLWNTDHGYDNTMRAFEASIDRLGLEYIDLYLIHWPLQDMFVSSWQAMEKLYADRRIRAIGVSNFEPAHLRELFDATEIVPTVNQIELHPYLPQRELQEFHAEHGIVTEAWGPLARGGSLLAEEVIASLATKYDKTPAQVVLRWHVQLGNVVIPKSVTPSRIAENTQIFDFELAEDDMTAIGELENGTRTGPNPNTFARR